MLTAAKVRRLAERVAPLTNRDGRVNEELRLELQAIDHDCTFSQLARDDLDFAPSTSSE